MPRDGKQLAYQSRVRKTCVTNVDLQFYCCLTLHFLPPTDCLLNDKKKVENDMLRATIEEHHRMLAARDVIAALSEKRWKEGNR